MHKVVGMLAGITALAVVSLPAKAETFLATSFNLIDPVVVNLTGPVLQNVYAGEVQLVGPGGSFDVFCLDLLTGINLPYLYQVQDYSVGGNFPGISPLNAGQVRQIASLIASAITFDFGPLARAATQLAIWQVEYGGAFGVTGLSAALQTDMNTRLALSVIGGILDCDNCILRTFTDAPVVPSQAFATVFVVPEVPIPGAIWLFGTVIAGLFGGKKWREYRARYAMV